MNSEELIGWLNVISSLLNREEYEQAIDYIEKKKKEIMEKEDPVDKYINGLVNELK